ncbi:hypothetical protein [Shewanella colwelliana]|uniref:hypothetical protein n=1 Tax=Shewanella colwelliana TaxID=23 RepID=UPI003735A899
MNECRPSIEDECVEATLAHQRMFTSVNPCDGCDSVNPKRYSVSGKCVSCRATGTKNTTDKRNYWNPGYHDLKAFNEVKAVNFMLHIFDERQRARYQKSRK